MKRNISYKKLGFAEENMKADLEKLQITFNVLNCLECEEEKGGLILYRGEKAAGDTGSC